MGTKPPPPPPPLRESSPLPESLPVPVPPPPRPRRLRPLSAPLPQRCLAAGLTARPPPPRAAPLAPGRTRAATAAEDADSPREMSIPRGHQLAMDAALLTMDSHTAACLIPAPPRAAMRPGSAPVRAMRARAAGAR
eukprot:scaffold48163_cov63-Phaeocystis_antarctica.AAC.1